MRITVIRVVLIVLTGFLAISAIPSAFLVVPTMPLDWIKAGPFVDWTIPAVALFLVGVLAGIATVALLIRPWIGALGAMASGAAIVVFEIVEVAVVGWTLSDPRLGGNFQAWLQLVFLVIGAAQIALGYALWLTVRVSAPPIPILKPGRP